MSRYRYQVTAALPNGFKLYVATTTSLGAAKRAAARQIRAAGLGVAWQLSRHAKMLGQRHTLPEQRSRLVGQLRAARACNPGSRSFAQCRNVDYPTVDGTIVTITRR